MRADAIQKMQTEDFDLVIIGGGITGAGVARDAASRGMSVALIEAQDFAEGTSSRSSKLIHGGIRYLENLEFGLVFEALSERRLLFDMAPHLVHPLRFVLPLYKGGRVGMFKMGLGMWLYDALSMFEAPELHERLSAGETCERLPMLQDRDLLGSFVYSDAYMDDDRLVIETLRSAEAQGAVIANRVKATGAQFENGKVVAIQAQDLSKGDSFYIRGRHFVSTVGPWTDQLGTTLLGQWHKILRPSKGVHITLDRNRLPLQQAVVMAADQQKRIVFGIPRHEMIIIGTTDTDFPDDPATVGTTPEDVRYLLSVAREYFPGADLTAQDILATYAGVRPLVDDGAETESKTSREHVILADPHNVTFVAGGKYTTYRRMAEQTVQTALHNFSLEEQVTFSCNRTKEALNPKASPEAFIAAFQQVEEWARAFGFSKASVTFLVERHGLEALDILQAQPLVAQKWGEEERLWALEASHAIRKTYCTELVDFYTRRSHLFLANRTHGLEFLEKLSLVFAEQLQRSDSWRHDQIQKVQSYVEREMAWRRAFANR